MPAKKGSSWKNHRYTKRTGTPGNYKYEYPKTQDLGLGEVDISPLSKKQVASIRNFIWPEVTAEEQALQDEFVRATGEAIPFYMDPYLIDRTLRIIDAAFLVSGAGILLKGVTGGGKLVLSRAARAQAKKAAMRTMKMAAKKGIVKGTGGKVKRRVAGKAINAYFNAGLAYDAAKTGAVRVTRAMK